MILCSLLRFGTGPDQRPLKTLQVDSLARIFVQRLRHVLELLLQPGIAEALGKRPGSKTGCDPFQPDQQRCVRSSCISAMQRLAQLSESISFRSVVALADVYHAESELFIQRLRRLVGPADLEGDKSGVPRLAGDGQ